MIGNVRMTPGRWAMVAAVVLALAVFVHYAIGQLLLWTEEGALKGGGMLLMTALILAHFYHYWSEAADSDE